MLGEILKNLRTANKFSQKYIADKLNVSQQMISLFENGTNKPDAYQIGLLADIFNVSTDYLLGRNIPRKFVPENIILLKSSKTWQELEDDIAKKLNSNLWKTIFNAKNLEKIANGKLELEYEQINGLSIYAGVNEDFFYKHNSQDDYIYARKQYKLQHSNKTVLYCDFNIPDELIDFITNEQNLKYIIHAKKLKDEGINPDKILNYTLKI